MKIIFIIESLLGVTGGNITLSKILQYLIFRKIDILILKRIKNFAPLDGVRVVAVPEEESFYKYSRIVML
jgi:hypothetical protein